MGHIKIVCLIGMPGAGKSMLATYAEEVLKIPAIRLGDLVREYSRVSGAKSPIKAAKNIRRRYGLSIVTERSIPKIRQVSSRVHKGLVLVDGVKGAYDVKMLRKEFGNVTTIAICCGSKTRFKRLLGRKRDDKPESLQDFLSRENFELSLGMGQAIASADYVVENEFATSPENLIRKFLLLLERISASRIQ